MGDISAELLTADQIEPAGLSADFHGVFRRLSLSRHSGKPGVLSYLGHSRIEIRTVPP